jgi:hypothetical protein
MSAMQCVIAETTTAQTPSMQHSSHKQYQVKQVPRGLLTQPVSLSFLDWRCITSHTAHTSTQQGVLTFTADAEADLLHSADTAARSTNFVSIFSRANSIGKRSREWSDEGWFVTQFRADSIIADTRNVLLWIQAQNGYSDVYLNGKRLTAQILDSTLPKRNIFFAAKLDSGINTLQIHYRDTEARAAFASFGIFAGFTGVSISIASEEATRLYLYEVYRSERTLIACCAAMVMLIVIHCLLFVFSPSEKAHLFYALETALIVYFILSDSLVIWLFPSEPRTTWGLMNIVRMMAQMLVIPSLVGMLTTLFVKEKLSTQHKTLLWFYAGTVICGTALQIIQPILTGVPLSNAALLLAVSIPSLFGLVEMIRLFIVGVRHDKSAWLLISGGVFFLGAVMFTIGKMLVLGNARVPISVNFVFAGMGFQVGMSLFLAWQAAQTKRNLLRSLQDVETLSAQMLEQERRAALLQLQKERERFRAESLAREATLTALKMQINPHFLFNALASIRTLSRIQPETAHEAITRLSSLFRYSLQSAKQETVLLREEMRIVKDYLALEELRFEDRLSTSFNVPTELETLAIPPMTLQILVENAVKHGIENERNGGEISIDATFEGSMLRITVCNTEKIQERSTGNRIGLENARERLKMIFGKSAEIALREITRTPDCTRVCAEVRYLPSQQMTLMGNTDIAPQTRPPFFTSSSMKTA